MKISLTLDQIEKLKLQKCKNLTQLKHFQRADELSVREVVEFRPE